MTRDFKINSLTGDLTIGDSGLQMTDSADEVGQRVKTRLQRELGEWFLNVQVGLPWYNGILGSKNVQVADMVIRREILDTEGVNSLDSFEAIWNASERKLTVAARISTIYGDAATVTVTVGA